MQRLEKEFRDDFTDVPKRMYLAKYKLKISTDVHIPDETIPDFVCITSFGITRASTSERPWSHRGNTHSVLSISCPHQEIQSDKTERFCVNFRALKMIDWLIDWLDMVNTPYRQYFSHVTVALKDNGWPFDQNQQNI